MAPVAARRRQAARRARPSVRPFVRHQRRAVRTPATILSRRSLSTSDNGVVVDVAVDVVVVVLPSQKMRTIRKGETPPAGTQYESRDHNQQPEQLLTSQSATGVE